MSDFIQETMSQNRISDYKFGRSKLHEKNMSIDGVYSNSRLMHSIASLVGCLVQVQVRDGSIYEGILNTFSHQLDLVLETAHKVSSKIIPPVGVGPSVSNLIASYPFEEGGISDKMIFRLSDIVTVKAANVDADFAIRDTFTDTAISKFNGQVTEKELEPWDGASSDSDITALGVEEDDGSNGWDANDMFRLNAEKYGVKSSYDTSMQEYTVPLQRKDTEEYKLKEAKASRIADEIENNVSYRHRVQLENGDEEDRYSAVVRPEDSGSKYVLPQKRKNAQNALKRQASTTMSPVHAGPLKSYPPLHGNKQQYMHHMKGPPPSLQGPPPHTGPPVNVPKESLNGEELLDDSSSKQAIPCSDTVPPNPPSKPYQMGSGPPQSSLPPRIERRRENERKMNKQKGRVDEIEEFRKFSSNFKLTEETREVVELREDSLELKCESSHLATKLAEQVKIEKDSEEKTTDISKSTLNPNAKEFVFNPHAKSFTPRSMNTSSPHQTTVGVQRLQAQSPVIVVPHSQIQMIPGLAQPIFTMGAPQYMVQPFTTQNPLQPPRFRKVPLTMQPRHDINPSMHVAAATGQPILAPAAMPTHSQLTMQYSTPQGVLHASGPPQQTMGYPQMNFVVGPRVVSPQPVGVVPTSHAVSYCDTSHLPTHLIMSAHPGANTGNSGGHSLPPSTVGHHHQQQHSNHPPQSATPVLPPSPSPHQMYPHFPPSAAHHPHPHQQLVLMPHHHHHPHHQGAPPHHMHQGATHHHMAVPQMTLIPTSTPYVQQPQGV